MPTLSLFYIRLLILLVLLLLDWILSISLNYLFFLKKYLLEIVNIPSLLIIFVYQIIDGYLNLNANDELINKSN